MNELAKEIHGIAVSKGFWDKPLSTGELLMLVVSELGEALEADRKGNKLRTENILKVGVNAIKDIDDIEEYQEFFEANIKDTFEDEIADAIIRLLDMCAAFDIDIETHIRLKMEYNKTRERLHGKKY